MNFILLEKFFQNHIEQKVEAESEEEQEPLPLPLSTTATHKHNFVTFNCQNDKRICKECGLETFSCEFPFLESVDAYSSNYNHFLFKEVKLCPIYKELKNLNLPQLIEELALSFYEKVLQNNTLRGNKRKAILFGCIFFAYRYSQNQLQTSNNKLLSSLDQEEFIQSSDMLMQRMNISKKVALLGIKYILINTYNSSDDTAKDKSKLQQQDQDSDSSLTSPPSLASIHNIEYSLETIILELCKEVFQVSSLSYLEIASIKDIFNFLRTKDIAYHRSKVKNIVIAIVYLYLNETNNTGDRKYCDFIEDQSQNIVTGHLQSLDKYCKLAKINYTTISKLFRKSKLLLAEYDFSRN